MTKKRQKELEKIRFLMGIESQDNIAKKIGVSGRNALHARFFSLCLEEKESLQDD